MVLGMNEGKHAVLNPTSVRSSRTKWCYVRYTENISVINSTKSSEGNGGCGSFNIKKVDVLAFTGSRGARWYWRNGRLGCHW